MTRSLLQQQMSRLNMLHKIKNKKTKTEEEELKYFVSLNLEIYQMLKSC